MPYVRVQTIHAYTLKAFQSYHLCPGFAPVQMWVAEICRVNLPTLHMAAYTAAKTCILLF